MDLNTTVPLSLAKDLELSQVKIKNLIEDCYIKYGFENFTIGKDEIIFLSNYNKTTEKEFEDGFFVFHIISPIQRLKYIDFFESFGVVTDFGNNKQILKVPYRFVSTELSLKLSHVVEEKVGKVIEKDSVIKYGIEFFGENILQPAINAFITVLTTKYC